MASKRPKSIVSDTGSDTSSDTSSDTAPCRDLSNTDNHPAKPVQKIIEFLGDAKAADVYDSGAKATTRSSFAHHCIEAAKYTNASGLLYLESAHGGATKELLKHFEPNQLYPCNKNVESAAKLQSDFPEVNVVKGNIYTVYDTRTWLGVWFDTEETWMHTHQPGQPWKGAHIPAFDRAHVVAVTLTTGSGPNPVKGGAEELANHLAHLFEENQGRMGMLPFAYDGKGGRMNMVFGIAKFNPCKKWQPRDYIYARLHIPVKALGNFTGKEVYMVKQGKYIATVVGVKDNKLLPVFMSKDGNFFEEPDPLDELSVGQVSAWMV